MMIDTHAHIQMDEFGEDRERIIERAHGAGVNTVLVVGIDVPSSKTAVELVENHEGLFATVGVQPSNLDEAPDDWADQIRALASHPKVKGIGETGMDLYRNRTDPDLQREALKVHLQIARDAGLPVVLHSRAAGKQVLDVIEEFGSGKPISGVMHCFTEQEPVMRRAVALGLHISFAGPVTYPISRKSREVLRRVPDSRVLVETDSPFLGAEPVKHRRNEPAYLRYVVTKVAEMRRISPRDASRLTSVNADDLFGFGTIDRRPRIVYGIRSALYVNLTNRCTSNCSFCPRTRAIESPEAPGSYYVKGHNLKLDNEPSAREIIDAMGDITPYREIVFCGLGEPTMRLPELLEIARWARAQGQRVRLDTNGHGNVFHKRSIVPDLAEVLDAVSISLNTSDPDEYMTLCRPGGATLDDVIAFIKDCVGQIPEVVVSAVEVKGVKVSAIKKLAHDLGVKYHGRRPDEVG